MPSPSKMSPDWEGPHKIISLVGDSAFEIEDVVTKKTRTVHLQHLARYQDADANITSAMMGQAAHDRYGFTLKRIDNGMIANGIAEVQFIWKGFEDEDMDVNTVETLEYALSVAPNLTKRYLRKLVRPPSSKEDRLLGQSLLEHVGLTMADVVSGSVKDL